MAIQEKYFLSHLARPGFPFFSGKNTAPRVPLHSHDFYEIAILAEGGMVHEFEFGETGELAEGDFVLINPFERHGYREKPGGLHLVNIVFGSHVLPMLGQGLGQEGLLNPFHFPHRIGRPAGADRAQIKNLAQTLLTEFVEQKEDWRLSVTGLLLQILTRCRRTLLVQPGNRLPARTSRLTQVLALIDGKFTEDITLGQIAKLAGLNATYMSELFRKQTGKTFKQYITERRLKYALHLLTHSPMAVREICLTCGFGDLTHFERLIKKQVGMAPLAWRKKSGQAIGPNA